MSTNLDPALVEKATRALSEHWRDMHTNESLGRQRMLAGHILSAVADDLRAEGAREALTVFAADQRAGANDAAAIGDYAGAGALRESAADALVLRDEHYPEETDR